MKLSFLSFARLTNSGMRSLWPISISIFSTASLAPPCAGPQSEAMPAAMQANGLAPEEPASRTAVVAAEQANCVAAGLAAEPHRRGRCVLLVVGMENEDLVHCLCERRADLVL